MTNGYVSTATNARVSKTGGTIYGSDVWQNPNIVKDSNGNNIENRGSAVCVGLGVNESVKLLRETSAGPDLILDSNISGLAGGWEN